MWKNLLICIGWILFVLQGQAQSRLFQTDSLQFTPGDTLFLSHADVVPFSDQVWVEGFQLPEDSYEINWGMGWLLVTQPTEGTCVVSYSYFAESLPQTLAIRSWQAVRDSVDRLGYQQVFLPPKETETLPFEEESAIRKSGSLSRGITVGNQQGLAVNSGLRLQLEGDLGDGLKIVGAVTDDNLPIQPDGTTQQISDFDKIFIKLSKDDYSLTVGDYEVNHKGTAFANFYRNVQGMKVDVANKQTRASVSGAVAKGKFFTNAIQGQEGVSGPYRLRGQNGEQFFIVLAGSEKVYLNGKLMRRGENLDYIINYNTAEIFFTPTQLITSVTRIVVDFEYADFEFNRSLLFAQASHKMLDDRLKVAFSYGRDSDNPNAPISDPEAYNAIRDSLAAFGDSTGKAITNGAVLAGYSATQTRYRQFDTLALGQSYPIYKWSQDSLEAVYQVSFSFVGVGEGDYIQDRSGQNRTIYRWVGPDSLTGAPQGDYSPIRSWVLPRLLQVVDGKINFQVNKHLNLYHESAISLDDKNRLSSLGDDDNQGIATRSGLQVRNIRLADSLLFTSDVSYQYVNRRYSNLDRIYKAEYNRIWDLENVNTRVDEKILLAKTRWDYKNKLRLETETGIRNAGPGSTASRQVYTVKSFMRKGLQGFYTFTTIQNKDEPTLANSRWNRHEGDVFMQKGIFRPGVEIWTEDRTKVRADTLGKGSFSFVDLKPYLRTVNHDKIDLDLSFNYRIEREYLAGQIRDKSEAMTGFARLGWRPSRVFSLLSTTSLRDFRVEDSLFKTQGIVDTRILNTNLQTSIQPKNRWLYANFVYDVSSEQTARKNVRFVEVNPGQGQYVWLDSLFNKDGIQQVDEFQLAANPLIANFVRVLAPSRQLFPTTRASLTGVYRMDFSRIVKRSEKPLKELARNFRTSTNFRITQSKSRDNRFSTYLIDVVNIFEDTTLIDANYSFQQNFNFFPTSKTGSFRFSYQENRAKLFLTTGDELRGLGYWGAIQRLNWGKNKSFEVESRLGRKFVDAVALPTRNYDIQFFETRPRLNFQLNRKFRLTTGYEFKNKVNQADSARIRMHKTFFDARWNLKGGNNLFGKLELVNVTQFGETSFAADYELKESLREGFNAIWQLYVTYYLVKNVELSITYDGRASSEIPVIHTGRVQVRALF